MDILDDMGVSKLSAIFLLIYLFIFLFIFFRNIIMSHSAKLFFPEVLASAVQDRDDESSPCRFRWSTMHILMCMYLWAEFSGPSLLLSQTLLAEVACGLESLHRIRPSPEKHVHSVWPCLNRLNAYQHDSPSAYLKICTLFSVIKIVVVARSN